MQNSTECVECNIDRTDEFIVLDEMDEFLEIQKSVQDEQLSADEGEVSCSSSPLFFEEEKCETCGRNPVSSILGGVECWECFCEH